MRTIKLVIEYDGTAYCGWQLQPNGLSIQEVMEGALAKILGAPVRLHSSGRTDAGVHAHGMVAAFTTDRTIPLGAFSDGLNSLLPPDVAVQEAAEAEPGFNPRQMPWGSATATPSSPGATLSLARLYLAPPGKPRPRRNARVRPIFLANMTSPRSGRRVAQHKPPYAGYIPLISAATAISRSRRARFGLLGDVVRVMIRRSRQ